MGLAINQAFQHPEQVVSCRLRSLYAISDQRRTNKLIYTTKASAQENEHVIMQLLHTDPGEDKGCQFV